MSTALQHEQLSSILCMAATVLQGPAAHNFSGGRALGSRYVLGLHAGRLGVTLIWNVWLVPGAAFPKKTLSVPSLPSSSHGKQCHYLRCL
jgi:hypothetical protein